MLPLALQDELSEPSIQRGQCLRHVVKLGLRTGRVSMSPLHDRCCLLASQLLCSDDSLSGCWSQQQLDGSSARHLVSRVVSSQCCAKCAVFSLIQLSPHLHGSLLLFVALLFPVLCQGLLLVGHAPL